MPQQPKDYFAPGNQGVPVTPLNMDFAVGKASPDAAGSSSGSVQAMMNQATGRVKNPPNYKAYDAARLLAGKDSGEAPVKAPPMPHSEAPPVPYPKTVPLKSPPPQPSIPSAPSGKWPTSEEVLAGSCTQQKKERRGLDPKARWSDQNQPHSERGRTLTSTRIEFSSSCS